MVASAHSSLNVKFNKYYNCYYSNSSIEHDNGTLRGNSSDDGDIHTTIPILDEDDAEDDDNERTLITPLLARALQFENLSSRDQMRKVHLSRVREAFRRHDTDSGSSEVQVAALSERVAHLTNHLRENRKDKAALRGLQLMLARRKKLLKYLHRTDRQKYYETIDRCKIKDQPFSQSKYKK